MNEKTCKACLSEFKPTRSFQKVCSPKCAIKLVNANKEEKKAKAWRLEKKIRKEKLKSKSEWVKEAEYAFRRYIRARDRLFYAKQGKPHECISCGTTSPHIQYAAGHYKTKGAYPELRLDERNCYLQCNKRCNMELSGNINGTKDTHGYKEGLKMRFGDEEGEKIIDYLESHHPAENWTIDDLSRMKSEFNKKANDIEKQLSDILT